MALLITEATLVMSIGVSPSSPAASVTGTKVVVTAATSHSFKTILTATIIPAALPASNDFTNKELQTCAAWSKPSARVVEATCQATHAGIKPVQITTASAAAMVADQNPAFNLNVETGTTLKIAASQAAVPSASTVHVTSAGQVKYVLRAEFTLPICASEHAIFAALGYASSELTKAPATATAVVTNEALWSASDQRVYSVSVNAVEVGQVDFTLAAKTDIYQQATLTIQQCELVSCKLPILCLYE